MSCSRAAAGLLRDEGIPPPLGRQSVGKPERIPSPRINDVVRELGRIANDPGSPRAGMARDLLREIERTRATIRDLEAQREAARRPDPSRQSGGERTRHGGPPPDPEFKQSTKTGAKEGTTTASREKSGTEPKPAKVAKVAPQVAPPPQATPKPSTVTPAGGGGTRVSPTTSTESIRKQVASVIAGSASTVARAQRFTRRLQGYLAAWGKLNAALVVLSAIETMGKLLAHGTALPKEQGEADKVLRDSQEALTDAEDAVENISLLGWTFIIGEALRNEDDQSLFALEEAMMKLRHPLEESEKTLKGVADDLFRSVDALQIEKLKQLVQIATPSLGGTGSNAVALAFHQALERLHGTLLTAARNYSTASDTPAYWAYQLKQLEDSANDAAWYVARKHAVQRAQQQQIEAAKQFRSEAPVVETEKERQAREFLESLRDPNTLRGGKQAE